MPRLTRTAKFADLRNQLLNDKEEYTKSEELSYYQNKLNNVKDTLVSDEEAKQNYWKNYQEPTYVQDPIQEDPIYQELLKKEFGENPFLKGVEETLTNNEPEVKEEPIVIENPAIEQVVKAEEPIVEEAVVEQVEEQEVVETPVEEPVVEDNSPKSSFFDSFLNDIVQNNSAGDNFNSYFENKENENSSYEDIFADVFNDVKDESGEIVNLKERETYLNQTFSDVDKYNQEIGEETINTAVENLIDEIRHPEKKYEDVTFEEETVEESLDTDEVEEPIEETVSTEDETFTSTVSLEISKIMDEVAGVANEEEELVEEEVTLQDETLEEVLDADDVLEDYDETIQVESVVQDDNTEDVVEIKNIAEIEREEANTISQTIPFVVADTEYEEDEDDDEGSNVVLNIILIVLIIVLIAVLGLIVFYILKTKGIL